MEKNFRELSGRDNPKESDAVWFQGRNYQEYCIDRICKESAVGIFIAPGLGKTISSLMSVRKLKCERFEVNRVLVIAPKKVAEATWMQEAQKWQQTRILRFSLILGTVRQRTEALPENRKADVYVVNRENVMWLVDRYRNDWPFDMVIIDESTSFKNPKTKRFKSLAAVRPHIKRIVELTGTPSPNGLSDLWAQIFLLDGGERLGKSFYGFRNRYFDPAFVSSSGVVYKYNLKPGAEKSIVEKVKDICVTMKAEDYLELPELIYDTIPVKLSDKALKAYDELEKEMILSLPEDEAEITTTSAAALTGKLLQLSNGAVYDEEGGYHVIHEDKLDALSELCESLSASGEHGLIFYQFVSDRERIMKRLLKYYCVEVLDKKNTADSIRRWNDGEIDFLLAHPASSGFGLNLQAGGHHVIWFGLTWNYEHFEQANKRLHRQGQRFPVIVHILSSADTKDELVGKALEKKENAQDYVMESLKARKAELTKNK